MKLVVNIFPCISVTPCIICMYLALGAAENNTIFICTDIHRAFSRTVCPKKNKIDAFLRTLS
jgi:hypothetical protein